MNFRKGRIFTIRIFLLLIFGVIFYRLYSIQIKDVYSFYGRYHRYKENRIIIPAERGLIYDRNGVALAGNEQAFKLEFNPGLFFQSLPDSTNPELVDVKFKEIANIISSVTSHQSDIILKRIENHYLSYPNGFELITDITVEEKEGILNRLKAYNLEGVLSIPQSSRRVYPKGNLAASLIGLFTEGRARSGVERDFNKILTGSDGWLEVIRYGTGQNKYFSQLEHTLPKQGNSIYLTIDTHIQTILEKNLEYGLSETNANNALGIIVSTNTGEILALKGLSAVWKEKSVNYQHSLPIYPVSWCFEPGSTLKPFVALFAMENGGIVAADSFDCQTRRVGARKISDVEEFGKLSTKDIIVHSSNVGMSFLVEELSNNLLYSKLVDFGFGHKSGILLGGESSGVLRKPNQWSEFSRHSLSFGQEISVTALQLVYAYAAIANKGELLQPNIISKITNYNGKILQKPERSVLRRVSTPTYLDTINTFLEAVVTDGHARTSRVEQFKIAGKTGTAEKYENGQLKEGKYVSMFAGYFPATDPEIAMLILMDEPDYEHRFGSAAAGPIFKKTVEELLVLPNSNLLKKVHLAESEYTVVPDCKGLKVEKAVKLLKNENIEYRFSGEGDYVVEQYPKPGFSILNKSCVQLVRTR